SPGASSSKTTVPNRAVLAASLRRTPISCPSRPPTYRRAAPPSPYRATGATRDAIRRRGTACYQLVGRAPSKRWPQLAPGMAILVARRDLDEIAIAAKRRYKLDADG